MEVVSFMSMCLKVSFLCCNVSCCLVSTKTRCAFTVSDGVWEQNKRPSWHLYDLTHSIKSPAIKV